MSTSSHYGELLVRLIALYTCAKVSNSMFAPAAPGWTQTRTLTLHFSGFAFLHAIRFDGAEHSAAVPLLEAVSEIGPPSQVQSQRWVVPPSFLDMNLILTLLEMGSRIALWEENSLRYSSAGGSPNKIPWKGCQQQAKGCNPATNNQTMLMHIPREDVEGHNGDYVLYELVRGPSAIQAVIIMCSWGKSEGVFCPKSKRGVYLAFSPKLMNGNSGAFQKAKDSLFNAGISAEVWKAHFNYTSDAGSMEGWTGYYMSIREEIWKSVAGALQLCDELFVFEEPCGLKISGNSMGGFFSHLAAFDLALTYEAGARSQLYRSSIHNLSRAIQVISVGSPRAGNKDFVDTINRVFRPDSVAAENTRVMAPLLRVINSADQVPGWPNVESGYPVDQGGIVFAIPNWSTEKQDLTPAGTVFKARCLNKLMAASACVSEGCEATKNVLGPTLQSALTHFHSGIRHCEPNLLRLMRVAAMREARAQHPTIISRGAWPETLDDKYLPHCPEGASESDLLVSGVDLDEDPKQKLLTAWLEHVNGTCRAQATKNCVRLFDDLHNWKKAKCCCSKTDNTQCKLQYPGDLGEKLFGYKCGEGRHKYTKAGWPVLPYNCMELPAEGAS